MGYGAVQAEMPRGLHAEAIEQGMKQGSIRVIAHLRVESVSEEQAKGAEQRREAIAQVREALFRELASTSYRVIRAYDTIPFIALEIWPDARQVLEKSALVVGIEDDKRSHPTSDLP